MNLTPLKNTLSKKFSSKNVVLYSGGCCCCCCCCILAPIGGYLAERIINKKAPERGPIWKHAIVNVLIGAVTLVLAYFGAATTDSFFRPILSVLFSTMPYAGMLVFGLILLGIMYALFYLYSFSWFNAEFSTEPRWRIVLRETLWTTVLGGVFFALSIIVVVVFFMFL